jgi:hypothetical protein
VTGASRPGDDLEGLPEDPRLDPAKDPDRFDPDRFDPDPFDPTEQPVVVGPLDLSQDPDRMPRPGEGQSLTDLLGKERSYEEDRDGYEWVFGLLGVLAFLALVAFLFSNVLSP